MGNVYFIVENEDASDPLMVKIGLSTDPFRRIKQLQTGNPRKLALMGWIEHDNPRQLERALHEELDIHRGNGEFFAIETAKVLEILMQHSVNSYIAVQDNWQEIIGRDRDAVPEILGSWEWADVEHDEFCPQCGWGGGLSYNENYGGERCLRCGFAPDYDSN